MAKDQKKSMTEKLMNPENVPKVLREQATKLRSKWRKVVTGDEKKRIRDRLRETEAEPKYVKFFDKVAFTVGVLNMGVCQYFLLNRPDLFPTWYSLIIPVILGSRYFYFRGSGLQYFMIDFCYFTIFCSMVNLLLVHNSPLFFKVCFICCTGPLTLAIPVWRNSFVFHDYDKIVSVYIHILPSMLYYTMRHRNTRMGFLTGSAGGDVCHPDNCDDLHLFDYLVALGLYMFWQMLYLVKTEFLDKERLDRNPELLTSLRWLAKDTKNAMARMFLKFYRKMGVFGKEEEYDSRTLKTKAVFVVAQLLFTVVAFLPTPFMYHSPTFHLLYILLIITSSVFNGASFYIEVFSKRYNSQIQKIEEMHQLAQAASSAISDLNTLKEASASTPRRTPGKGSGGGSFGAQGDAAAGLSVLAPKVMSAERAEGGPVMMAADVGVAEQKSVENLSKLTALLQRTSDSAWQEMKELVQHADAMRGLAAEERLSEDDVYLGIGADDSPSGEDYVVCDRSAEVTPHASSDGGEGGSGKASALAVDSALDGKDDEVDQLEADMSPLGRSRNNSVLSIDR
jgi:hypothetical protein